MTKTVALPDFSPCQDIGRASHSTVQHTHAHLHMDINTAFNHYVLQYASLGLPTQDDYCMYC